MSALRPAFLALAVLALPISAPAQPSGAAESRLVFAGRAPTRAGTGPRVEIRNWSLREGLRISDLKLPFRGTLIVELRAGKVVTVIDGRRVERREGEIWAVPPAGVMTVQTGDDMAVLQTTLIGE